MSNKIIFSKTDIDMIVHQYTIMSLSCEQIGKLFNMSKMPINKLLKDLNLLKKSKSNGKKIILTEEQKNKIKELYIVEGKTSSYISKELKLNLHFIEKYIYNSDFKRTKGESITLRQTGKKENRWSNKIDTNQYEKIKWVNSNIKPVQILVIDKRNNRLIKKEIV